MIEAINHIGIVVTDVQAAVKSYERLGLKATDWETVVRSGIDVEIAFVPIGGVCLELIQPLKGSQSRFTKFIAEKGEGVHHLALQVKNIEEAVGVMKKQGLSFEGEEPMKATRGSRALWLKSDAVRGTFIHLSDYPEAQG